jgi:hypothetical protein
MQKVEGSSPFSRSDKSPPNRRVFVWRKRRERQISVAVQQLCSTNAVFCNPAGPRSRGTGDPTPRCGEAGDRRHRAAASGRGRNGATPVSPTQSSTARRRKGESDRADLAAAARSRLGDSDRQSRRRSRAARERASSPLRWRAVRQQDDKSDRGTPQPNTRDGRREKSAVGAGGSRLHAKAAASGNV